LDGDENEDKKIINILHSGVDSNPLMCYLQRMVTLLKRLKMDEVQYYITSKSLTTLERSVIN
jgi:hypothetical protein